MSEAGVTKELRELIDKYSVKEVRMSFSYLEKYDPKIREEADE